MEKKSSTLAHSGVPTILQTFEMIFPQTLVQSVIIKNTNKHLQKPASYIDFIAWSRLLCLMATIHFWRPKGVLVNRKN